MTIRPAAGLLHALTFACVALTVWGLRWALRPESIAASRPRIQVPAGFRGAGETEAKGIDSGDPKQSSQLHSVRMGLVIWPENGDSREVNEAFAAAWRKLRPGVQLVANDRESKADAGDKARQIFADWWKVDPEGALRFVSEPPGLLMERGGFYLLPLLAASDPVRAWALADKGGDGSQRLSAQQQVLTSWASRAPDEAMAFAAALPAHRRLKAESSVLAAWPAERAFEWCTPLPESWRKHQLLNDLLRSSAVHDPAAVAAALRRGAVTPAMVNRMLGSGGQDTSNRIMRAALSAEPDPLGVCLHEERSGRAMMAACAWTALIEKRGVSTPEDIAKLADTLPDKPSDAFMDALGRAAPEAGLAWALNNGVQPARLLMEWARGDPDAAIAALRNLPANEQSLTARLAVAQEFSKSNPEVAVAALENYPNKAEAAPFMRSAARGIARTDPALALQLLTAAPTTTPAEVSVILAIGGRSDPQATAAALAVSDLPVTHSVAAESFTRGWGTADPEAASLWVRELPAGDLRDGGAAGLARTIAESDPVSAFAWGLEIAEPDIKARVLGTVYDQVVRRGLPVDELLSDSRLTPVERGNLRARAAGKSSP